MSNKMKCPFCKEEIISDLCLMCDKIDKGYTSGRQIYKCNKCSLFGNKELWQALIQAKQDLEIARQALEDIRKEMDNDYMPDFAVISEALKALEQITHDNNHIADVSKMVEHKE